MGILDLSIAVPNFQGEEIVIQRDVMSFSKYHKHQFIEIAYFYHGVGTHIIDGEVFDIKAGDIFVLNSGVLHQFKGEDLRVINVMFSANFISPDYTNDDFVRQFCESHFDKNNLGNIDLSKYLYVPDFSCKYSDTIIYDMLQECNMRMECCSTILRNKVEILMINLMRLLLIKDSEIPLLFSHKNILEKAISLIDENVTGINKVDDITDKIGYNKLYFNRLFKNYMGMSISKYIRKKKMEKASNLLMHTNYTIEKIAEMVGYVDMKSFYSAFRQEMNTSPGSYRVKFIKVEKVNKTEI